MQPAAEHELALVDVDADAVDRHLGAAGELQHVVEAVLAAGVAAVGEQDERPLPAQSAEVVEGVEDAVVERGLAFRHEVGEAAGQRLPGAGEADGQFGPVVEGDEGGAVVWPEDEFEEVERRFLGRLQPVIHR